jgi:alpha-tubulin suppressor-like RCC1 family protein
MQQSASGNIDANEESR